MAVITLIYTSQSISGYNSSPPPDDGSQTESNKVKWSYHKTKIGDPIKTLAEGINSQATTGFNVLALEDFSAITTSATMAEADWHNGQLRTATGGTIHYPDPTSLENGWHNFVFNAATDEVSLQATASTAWRNHYGRTASEILVAPGRGVKVFTTATVWISQGWAPALDSSEVAIMQQMFS